MGGRIVVSGWGPERLLNGAASTGASAWATSNPCHANWGIAVLGGNSTSVVHAKVVLRATLDMLSTAPTGTTIATWTSTGGAPTNSDGQVVYVTGKPAGRVQARVDALSSTSSTAPTASVWVGGA